MKNVLNESLSYLSLDSKLIKKLNENNILTVEQLWVLSRKELKKMNITDQEIHQIMIRLELHGLDLGKKIVKM